MMKYTIIYNIYNNKSKYKPTRTLNIITYISNRTLATILLNYAKN